MLKTVKNKKVDPREKSLIVFDLDGTLIESKSSLKKGMASLIKKLLQTKKVSLIGGAKFQVFKELFLNNLDANKKDLKNLYIFPATSTSFYRFERGKWKKIFERKLPESEKKKIFLAFKNTFRDLKYIQPKKIYGKLIEDRGAEVVFSALGQDVVKKLGAQGVFLKKKWVKKNRKLRKAISLAVQKKLPNLWVREAGYTSIDVTPKGIDKAFGIRQMKKHLKIKEKNMLFIGDALFSGGNDHAVLKTRVDAISTSGPKETERFIKEILKNSN